MTGTFASWLLAAVLSLVANASVHAQALDTAKSSIGASFKQMNVPINGQFNRFTAQISFDPAKVDQARANLEIDMSSFDLGKGLDDYNDEVRKKDWFDTARFPKASFTVSSARALSGNRIEAAGKLSLKGKTADVLANLSWKDEGANRIFDGQVPIKRSLFGIGEGEWRDTSVVADEVIIKFRIVTAR
jgi:polyisoprenoid-binding protein YceI